MSKIIFLVGEKENDIICKEYGKLKEKISKRKQATERNFY